MSRRFSSKHYGSERRWSCGRGRILRGWWLRAGVMGTRGFIKLFHQFLRTLKILHNKSFKITIWVYTLISNHRNTNENHVVLLCVHEIARKFLNDNTHCKRGCDKTDTTIHCWAEGGKGWSRNWYTLWKAFDMYQESWKCSYPLI